MSGLLNTRGAKTVTALLASGAAARSRLLRGNLGFALFLLAVSLGLAAGMIGTPLGSGAAQRVVFTHLGQVSWAPGNAILFTGTPKNGHPGLYLLARGREPRLLSRDAATSGAWSPDSKRIALFDGNDLVIMRPDGSGRVTLRQFPGAHLQAPSYSGGPMWSPNGRKLAYAVDGSHVWVIDVRTHTARTIWASSGGVSAFAWSPDSHWVALVDCLTGANGHCRPGRLWVVPATGGGAAHRLPGVYWPEACVSWAPAKLIAATAISASGGVVVTSPDGRYRHVSVGVDCASWSPDGRHLAGATPFAENGRQAIGVALANDPAFEAAAHFPEPPWSPGGYSNPSWSPDGYQLVGWWGFGKGLHTFEQLYVLNVRLGTMKVLLRTATT